ncbi:MAG: DUF58 domain-containing protein [Pseudomonadota bacterium]|nr:DUF58 domain-containing protein [Pseudomonadota bacterium]
MSLQPHLDDLLELRHKARTLGLASHHLVNSRFSGLYASVFRGFGLDFEEVREYREGDDIRNMDWNVTARTNLPHLKIFREEREREVMICVDAGVHMNFGTRGTFKSVQAARAAALLGWAANNHHDRVGGLLFGREGIEYFRPERGRRGLWRLLHGLSRPPEEGGNAGSGEITDALLKLARGSGTGSLVFVIGDFNRDCSDLERPLGHLRQRHSVMLLPLDDPADSAIPAMGRVAFRTLAGELMEVDTDDPAGRAAYASEWKDRRRELLNMTNRLGISFQPLRTDEDVHRALAEGLQRKSGMRARV